MGFLWRLTLLSKTALELSSLLSKTGFFLDSIFELSAASQHPNSPESIDLARFPVRQQVLRLFPRFGQHLSRMETWFLLRNGKAMKTGLYTF